MESIYALGGQLVAALDKSDSVGILDRFFPHCAFFTEFERFDRHLEKLKLAGEGIDYLVICTPNYLHDAHIRYGLRHGVDVICEKPVVLNPWNLEHLLVFEKNSGRTVHPILQVRYHPVWQKLAQTEKSLADRPKRTIQLTYITPRGHWYHASWKGELEKSGGVITNIGIHLLDALCWVYGAPIKNDIYLRTFDRAAGTLELEYATINWFLSTDADLIEGNKATRVMIVDDQEYDFSAGIEKLHDISYEKIVSGEGWSLNSTREAITICHELRNAPLTPTDVAVHPLARKSPKKHPFKKY